MLRKLVDVIGRPLSVTSEQSWQPGEVLEDRKRASITPILKQGKKEDPENYRLLNLTSVPGKVMKKIL